MSRMLINPKLTSSGWIAKKIKIIESGTTTTIYKAWAPIATSEFEPYWAVSKTVVEKGAFAASAVLTMVLPVAGDIVTIESVNFEAVASSPTGDQWLLGATNTANATNLAAAINASVNVAIDGIVTATATKDKVAITADTAGAAGNSLTLTLTLSAAGITVLPVGGTLTGGADASSGTTSVVTTWAYGTDQSLNDFVNPESLTYS